MRTFRATVVNGQIKLVEPCDLPEGTVLHVAVPEEGDEMDPADRAQLELAIAQSWAQAQAGQLIPFEEVLDELRSTE